MTQQQRRGAGPDSTNKELKIKDRSKDVPNISKTIEGIEEALQQREDFYSELVCPICGLPCSHCAVACNVDQAVPFDTFLASDNAREENVDYITSVVKEFYNDSRNQRAREIREISEL